MDAVMAAVENAIDDLEAAMNGLKSALSGVPYRQGSFQNTHRRFAKDAAFVVAEFVAARALFREESEHSA
jgi:hypothetical protein